MHRKSMPAITISATHILDYQFKVSVTANLPSRHLLIYGTARIKLEGKSHVVIPTHVMHTISLAFSSARTRKTTFSNKNTHGYISCKHACTN